MKRKEAIKHLSEWMDEKMWRCFGTIDREAIGMAIEALKEVQKHEETFEWCHDCKEYDKENYCCHRWSKVIRNTVEEIADRPKGEWIAHATSVGGKKYIEYSRCSECGEMALVRMNFCPNCGADMRTVATIQTGQTCGKSAYIKELAEVVRCKDCRWYRDTFLDTKITPTCDRHIDDRYGTLVGGITEDSFCSYGERGERREP